MESLLTSIRSGLVAWLGQQPFCSEWRGQYGRHRNCDSDNHLFQKFAMHGSMGRQQELEGIWH